MLLKQPTQPRQLRTKSYEGKSHEKPARPILPAKDEPKWKQQEDDLRPVFNPNKEIAPICTRKARSERDTESNQQDDQR
jgi:hypothetical protein